MSHNPLLFIMSFTEFKTILGSVFQQRAIFFFIIVEDNYIEITMYFVFEPTLI